MNFSRTKVKICSLKSAFILFTMKQKLFIFSFYKAVEQQKQYMITHIMLIIDLKSFSPIGVLSLRLILLILIHAHSHAISLLIFILNIVVQMVNLPGFCVFILKSFVKGATKLYFTHQSCVVIILFNKGLCKSVFSTYSFGRLVFCLYAFFVITACSEFDVLFINFCNICIIIIYIVGITCFCSHFSLLT